MCIATADARAVRAVCCQGTQEADPIRRGMNDTQILLLILPIVAIQVALVIVALRDLVRPERRVRGESKLMWGIIIVLFGLLGPILYLTVGRRPE
jgi:hypothetical protein